MITSSYDLIIFDWDGTAVPDRNAPIGDLKNALEQLLKEGAHCAIVTGTNLDNILKQGIADLSPLAKHGLHICTNRGSEVYDFDSDGKPHLIYRKVATQSENKALDESAINLQNRIKTQGMTSKITFNRLNRRKVDLIPEPEWTSPKKAQFRELLTAVETRLSSAGFRGGIQELMKIAEDITHGSGLSNPKITSDIKHIEIGLTDKSDSASWIAKSIMGPEKIPLSKVSVWGDELGSLGNLPGSDALMRTSELKDASFFSVGIEPEGVPKWVSYMGGGPKRFIEFLIEQANLRRNQRAIPDIEPSADSSWILEQNGFDPSHERLMETLFAISNGNLGVRGSSDLPVPAAQSDLFIAGLYDQRVSSQAYSEVELFDASNASQSKETEIVPLPFPFRMGVLIDDEAIHAGNVNRIEHTRCLDFKKGSYFEDNLLESSQGRRSEVSSLRFCSHADAHLLIQRLRFTAKNYSAHIGLNLSLYPDDLADLYPHLHRVQETSVEPLSGLAEHIVFETIGSRDFITLASRIMVNGRELKCPHISTDLSPGESLLIERYVSAFWNPDFKISTEAALAHSKSLSLNLADHLTWHTEKWTRFWSVADIHLPKAPGPTAAIRFNLYHLQSSAALTPQTSVPAKALTGRAYEGHIFWDTEIFIFPFFLYTEPEIARQLLLYRYNTLCGAKKRATQMGFRGACYAWESTETGMDVTPRFVSISGRQTQDEDKIPIFTGPQELHITADVAWAVFKYWDATLDHEFMCNVGVEILIETARFWASRVVLSNDHYHVHEIAGPDEYHHGVSDNAFTNWMVRFNLDVAIRMVAWISIVHPDQLSVLSTKVNFTIQEVSTWEDIWKRLYIPLPGKDGVIEQFSGFFDLKSASLGPSDKNHAPISRLLGWKEINQTRIIKQADVLMIPFLFPDQLPPHVIKANYDYYDPITDQGSSLSPCVHAAIAARIGNVDDALQYWKQSLYFDLHNKMSNSQLGIHAAAIGGTWQALMFHFLGVHFTEGGMDYNRNSVKLLPNEWDGLEVKFKYRSRIYSLLITSGKIIEQTKEAA